jgi:predicted RNase H-like HicB family nuclease
MMPKYEIMIYWSGEDQAFIAEVPQLPGCVAHGDTQDNALRHANEAIELWISTDPVPTPKGRRLMLA